MCAIQCLKLICESTHPAASNASLFNEGGGVHYCDFCPCSAIKVVGLAPDQASAYDKNSGIGPITACADPSMLPNFVSMLFTYYLSL